MVPSKSTYHLNRKSFSTPSYFDIFNSRVPRRRVSVDSTIKGVVSVSAFQAAGDFVVATRSPSLATYKFLGARTCWWRNAVCLYSLRLAWPKQLFCQRSNSFVRPHFIRHRSERSSFNEFCGSCHLLHRPSSCWAMRLWFFDGLQSAAICNVETAATYCTISTGTSITDNSEGQWPATSINCIEEG